VEGEVEVEEVAQLGAVDAVVAEDAAVADDGPIRKELCLLLKTPV
jgi:hypothetical protein